MSDKQEAELDELGDFLDDHYEKFAIMGIFGTVTVLLSSNWPGSSDSFTARIGTVASLLIFSLAAFWITAKCYQELRAHSGRWPQLPEIGYAVILAGTVTLGGAVLFASQIYTVASQLLAEFILVVVLALVYAWIYPGDLDLPSQDEKPRYETLSTFAVLGGAYIALSVYRSTLGAWLQESFGLNLLLAPFAVVFGLLFFALRESLIGVVQMVQGDMNDLRERILGVWKIRTSFAISVLAVSVLTFYTRDVAHTTGESNMGYYRILGMPSTEFTLIHWIGVAAVFSFLVLNNQRLNDASPLLGRFAQAVAILTILLVVAGVVWFVPNGSHVIRA